MPFEFPDFGLVALRGGVRKATELFMTDEREREDLKSRFGGTSEVLNSDRIAPS